jgi:sugar/nucleoside kinase (ribokinase family)
LPADGAVIAGLVCVDLRPQFSAAPRITPGALQAVGPLDLRVGGCVGNTGLALAALGTDVRLAASIGDDALGGLVTDALGAAPRVDAGAVHVVPGAATAYTVVVDPPASDRSFWHCTGANDTFDPTNVDLESARLFHLGYPSLLARVVDDAADGLVAYFAQARARGVMTSLDIAMHDASSPAAKLDWAKILSRLLREVDVFSPSIDELRRVVPTLTTVEEAARWVRAQGCPLVMVTDGARGSYALSDDFEGWTPAFAVDDVATTTGAGDAATAGLLHGLLSGFSVGEAVVAAAATAAACVEGLAMPEWSVLAARVDGGWLTL